MDEATWQDLPPQAKYARWEWLVLSKNNGLTTSERMICLTLLSYFRNSGRAFPSHDRLADQTGLSARRVQDLLKSLERKKWISITLAGRGGLGWRRREYELLWPSNFSADSDEWMAGKAEDIEEWRSDEGWKE